MITKRMTSVEQYTTNTAHGFIYRWTCEDPKCPGGEVYMDVLDPDRDAYNANVAGMFRARLCPNQHDLPIF